MESEKAQGFNRSAPPPDSTRDAQAGDRPSGGDQTLPRQLGGVTGEGEGLQREAEEGLVAQAQEQGSPELPGWPLSPACPGQGTGPCVVWAQGRVAGG